MLDKLYNCEVCVMGITHLIKPGLMFLSSDIYRTFFVGRRYPNNILFKSRLSYTCGILRSFSLNIMYLCDEEYYIRDGVG